MAKIDPTDPRVQAAIEAIIAESDQNRIETKQRTAKRIRASRRLARRRDRL